LADNEPTVLQAWITTNSRTYNQLAKEISASPHTIKKMALGMCEVVNREILQKLSQATGLSYSELLDPSPPNPPATDSGDRRIDVALQKISRYLHTREMVKTCRKFFSLDFKCSGAIYSDRQIPAINFDEMCHLNACNFSTISPLLLDAHWYDPNCDTFDSRILHTYWRSMVLPPTGPTHYVDTFIVIAFEKSVSEMLETEMPKIKTWWWHTPDKLMEIEWAAANHVPLKMFQGIKK
tara:strand:- start:3 stop:713 length:711 start_codon:yes stop_codon:yes gene_type:complete